MSYATVRRSTRQYHQWFQPQVTDVQEPCVLSFDWSLTHSLWMAFSLSVRLHHAGYAERDDSEDREIGTKLRCDDWLYAFLPFLI